MADGVISDAFVFPREQRTTRPLLSSRGNIKCNRAQLHNMDEWFWEHVDKGEPDECWEWQGKTHKGYGQVNTDGETTGAHRIAYRLENGDPGDLHVLHTCDNPPCVNPAHLYAGTHQDNMRDAVERDRFVKGSDVINSKLTEGDARDIKERLVDGEKQASIAEDYGVARQTVESISTGKSWEHVEVDGFEPSEGFQKGEESHQAKLTESDVRDILRRVENGETQARLAEEYGVHPPAISRIVNGKRWTHITAEEGVN